jgi:hypothetical protein
MKLETDFIKQILVELENENYSFNIRTYNKTNSEIKVEARKLKVYYAL